MSSSTNSDQLLSPDIGVPYTHHFLDRPTARFHYIKTAAPSSVSSPTTSLPLIFIHGWPDYWYTWRYQLSDLSSQYQCIAVDQRGFGYTIVTDKPDDPNQYSHANAAKDTIAMMDAEKIDKAIVIGHDWGGMTVWTLARRYTSRIFAAISCATPYFPRTATHIPLLELVKVSPRFAYQVYFSHFHDHATKEFESDLYRTFSILIRGSDPSQRLGIMFSSGATSLFGSLLGKEIPPSSIISQEELENQCKMFAISGFGPGLIWYQGHAINWKEQDMTEKQLLSQESSINTDASSTPAAAATTTSSTDSESLSHHINVPVLMITASHDPVLTPTLANGMEALCSQFKRVDIQNGGHWVQLEQKDAINTAIQQFIEDLLTKTSHDSSDTNTATTSVNDGDGVGAQEKITASSNL